MTTLTTQQRLDAAKEAYHALLLGAAVREVRDQNGEMVVYTAANRDALRAYIQQLEAELAAATGGAALSRRPLQVFF